MSTWNGIGAAMRWVLPIGCPLMKLGQLFKDSAHSTKRVAANEHAAGTFIGMKQNIM